jgi:hypothetical protein
MTLMLPGANWSYAKWSRPQQDISLWSDSTSVSDVKSTVFLPNWRNAHQLFAFPNIPHFWLQVYSSVHRVGGIQTRPGLYSVIFYYIKRRSPFLSGFLSFYNRFSVLYIHILIFRDQISFEGRIERHYIPKRTDTMKMLQNIS